MPEWFEDDSFWVDLYPYLFPEERLTAGEEQVEKILRLTGIEQGAVLDLCCGPGRHSIPLTRHGFTVTAVDRTAFFLDKARERAAEARVAIEFVLEDMRRFVRDAAFDLATNLFTSFGYFDRKEDDLAVLSNLHASLRSGGALVVDVVGKEWLARHFQPTISQKFADGALFISRHEIFDDWTRIRNEWTLIREGRVKTWVFHHTLYSGQEFRDLLERAGFRSIALHGDLDGNPYGLEAKRLVAVARK